MIKKSFIIFSVLILILSLFFVSAHKQDVQDEKFYFDEWLDNLWGKITGQSVRTASTPTLTSDQEIAQSYWTQWFNRDAPSGSGDYETLNELKNENPGKICDTHSQIECQTITGIDYSATGEVVICDVNTGSVCVNSQQLDGKCNYDYKVRFYCGTLKTEASKPTLTPDLVESVEESTSPDSVERRDIFFRRTSSFQAQPAPTDSTTPETFETPQTEFARESFEQEVSPEIIEKGEEIKRLNLELVELNDKYSRNQIFFKKRISNKLEELTIEREKEMIELAKENPIIFLNNVMSEEKRNLFSDKIKEHIEEETTIEGKLLTLHIDDFSESNNPVSKFEYFIITAENKKINFYPIKSLGFIPESEIKVSGYKIDENIMGFVREIQIKGEKTPKAILGKVTGKAIQYPSPEIPKTPGEHKVAVILVNFLDSPQQPFTPAEAHDLIFNGQFQSFYQEQSYNKIYFTGDVFGWFTLPRNSTCEVAVGFGNELDSYIINNNIDFSNYDHLVLLINSCGNIMSTLGSLPISIDNQIYNISIAWIFNYGSNYLSPSARSNMHPPNFSWTNLDFSLVHEMGHSLGLMHANGYDCNAQSLDIITNCSHNEYGNPFDVMGTGEGYSFHLNSLYKERLGWISPQEILIINQSGNYTINNLETFGSKKFAKIKILGSDLFPYYLEYRKDIGFDSSLNYPDLISNQNGLLINKRHYTAYLPFINDFPRILDMNATSSSWYEDLKSASLSGNNIFNDPRTGITIGPIVSATNSNITFNVNLQQTNCIREQPKILADSWNVYNYPAGNLFYISFSLLNEDSPICGVSYFNMELEPLPFGFLASWFATTPYEIYPDQITEHNLEFNFQTSPTLCTGSYPISFSVENLNSGLITTKTIYVNLTGTTPCNQVALPEL